MPLPTQVSIPDVSIPVGGLVPDLLPARDKASGDRLLTGQRGSKNFEIS